MQHLLSERHNTLSVSKTIQMAQLSRELKAEGKDVISLSLGEPDFSTPEHIKQAAIRGVEENYNSYPPVSGYQDLKEAIVNKFKRDNNLDFETNQVLVSTGAKQSLTNIMLALLNPGDEVIIPAPFWVSYTDMVKLAQGESVIIKSTIDDDFKITPEKLRANITDKTKVFLLTSPSNPTGSVYTKEELAGFVEVLKDYPDIIIISDEIYELINFDSDHNSIVSFPEIKDRVVIVNGVSKGYAMTGWRIGYIAGPAWLTKACEKIQGQVTSGASCIAQRATIDALNGDHAPSIEMKEAFFKRRALVKSMLDDIPGIKSNMPKGAFYFFPNIQAYFGKSNGTETIENADDFCMKVLQNCHVALVGGSSFGNDNCMRISYAASEADLTEALTRLKKYLSTYEL